MNKCLQCNKEINQVEGKKARLFCNDVCRITYKRKQLKSEQNSQIKSEQSNPNTLKSIKSEQVKYNPEIHERQLTKNEKAGITEYGKCHNCGEKVSYLICLCYKCVSNGITHQTLGIDISKCE